MFLHQTATSGNSSHKILTVTSQIHIGTIENQSYGYNIAVFTVFNKSTTEKGRHNHCGRHLGKIKGHKSIYVLTWRCIQDEFYVIFMQPCLNKLLQWQAEVCVLVVNAKQVTIHRPSYFSQVAVLS